MIRLTKAPMWVTECEKRSSLQICQELGNQKKRKGGIGIVLGALLREESDK